MPKVEGGNGSMLLFSTGNGDLKCPSKRNFSRNVTVYPLILTKNHPVECESNQNDGGMRSNVSH